MRFLCIVILAGLCSITARAEDWTTTDGKTYKNVTVVKHDAVSVTILDQDGGATVPLSNLSPDLQKRFEYDPVAAKEELAKRQADRTATTAQMALDKEEANTVYSKDPAENEAIRQMEVRAKKIQADDLAHGYGHCSGRILQVLPDGFIADLSTRWGIYHPCYVKCDPKGLIDYQTWSGILIPQDTYHYTNAMGASATIPAFTTDLKQTASAPVPSNYVAPRAPVSSSQAVGGGT